MVAVAASLDSQSGAGHVKLFDCCFSYLQNGIGRVLILSSKDLAYAQHATAAHKMFLLLPPIPDLGSLYLVCAPILTTL